MKTLLALLAFTLTTQAQLITDFSGESNVSTGPGTSGIQFVANESLTLRSVGIYDWDTETPGLYSSHAIGLWDAVTHELLASATVPQQGAVAIGDWWYVALAAPITLQSGHSYVLAAQYVDNDFDFSAANASSVTTDPRITLVDALLSSGTGFSFPDIAVPGASYGFFGPNAMETAVPEPAAVGGVVSALLLAFATLRRRIAWKACRLFHRAHHDQYWTECTKKFFRCKKCGHHFSRKIQVCLAMFMFSIPICAENSVTIRSILDAKPAERQRLIDTLAKKRPMAFAFMRRQHA